MRIFSGIQPTGAKHLGNYIGAIRNYVATQEQGDAFFCIVDLHSITTDYQPEELREATLSLAALLFAAGLDPDRSTVFVQSHVSAHPEAAWLLGAVTSYGELRRMTQFKEKGDQQEFVSAGLFTYPVLQAADILLYQTDVVPIGDDQRQHLELSRNVAERFNSRFGETFRLPEALIPEVGGRIMDLQEPSKKMSTTGGTPQGTVGCARPAGDHSQEVQDRRHRFRHRRPARAGREAGDLQPDGDPGDHGRPGALARSSRATTGRATAPSRTRLQTPWWTPSTRFGNATKSFGATRPSSTACSPSARARRARPRLPRSSGCTSAWASSGPDHRLTSVRLRSCHRVDTGDQVW